ncbi:MAG: arabinosyltransferase domain-containing protein, partial [Pseudonocardia sp.]
MSSTAILVPYRPAELNATLPCPVLRAAAARGRPTTVLATGGSTDTGAGLLVRVDGGQAGVFVEVLVNARLVAQASVPVSGAAVSGTAVSGAGVSGAAVSGADAECGVSVIADQRGVRLTLAGRTQELAGEPVPEVASFRTDLDPGEATGLAVTARTVNPFDTVPTGLKTLLLVVQLLAAGCGLVLLGRWSWRGHRLRPTLVDGGVFAVLAGWAVIGPLSDDDGFVTMIARNSLVSGDVGNYYRWWSASESPFTLAQRVVAVLSHASLQPLWLRAPSTMMGAAAWLVLSRGVLGAVPGLAGGRARTLLAVCFLVAWLPYNLGVRPEPYVALGTVVVLALLWRGRGPVALGLATLVAVVTVTASPSGLLVVAAVPVFAGKIVQMLRAGPDRSVGSVGTADPVGRGEVVARLALLGAIGAVGLSIVFADQSLHGLVAATRWHAEFSPSLPWDQEIQRYRYLLGDYQDGNALKRVPVLLCLALLPPVTLLLARRSAAETAGLARDNQPGPARDNEPGPARDNEPGPARDNEPGPARDNQPGPARDNQPGPARRDELEWAVGRLAGCVAVGLVLLWLTPSKWTLYFGSLAGVFGGFLAVSTVLLARRARDGRLPMRVALLGGGLVAVAAGLAFAGTNDWWQPALYAVPWAAGPIRPAGLPLDLPPLWAGAALAVAG